MTAARQNRPPCHSLKLFAALNMLLFAGALLNLPGMPSEVHAQEVTACSGKNLMEELARTDLARLEQAKAEAAKIINGTGRFWKIDKDGLKPSWLMGTMHLADPRIIDLPKPVLDALETTGTMVIETTGILDPSEIIGALAANPELTMFTDGSTLFSHLSEADADVLRQQLEARGIPPFSVQKMKPWLLNSTLSVPACQEALISTGRPVLDVMLAQDAEEQGKAVEGLESLREQFDAMASLSIDFHMRGLIEIIKLGDLMNDINETMLQLYMEGEIGMIMPVIKAAVPETPSAEEDYAAFEERLITVRNRTMAERAVPILEKGNIFIAVGALHLPGEQGLVELLRKQGFTVTAVPES